MSKNVKKERIEINRSLWAYQEGGGACKLTVSIDSINKTSSASVNGEMKHGEMVVENVYRGVRKEKVDSSMPYSLKEARDANTALNKYDFVCAVDTNSKKIGDEWIDVGSVFQLIRMNGGVEPYFLKEFEDRHRDERPDFEKRNWIRCIKFIQEYHLDAKKVVIVVDSDFGNVEYYNTHSEKILGEMLLPDGFKLIYASSDRGSDWMNKLIKASDKYNQMRLGDIEKNE